MTMFNKNVVAREVKACTDYNVKEVKEVLELTFDFVRVSASYQGATAEEVEYFLTRELEESLEGIDGIKILKNFHSPP